MLTRGGAKLMDFGVAKRRAIAGSDAQSTSLTAQGTIVGTVRYMSPEQVEGRDTDHRSDLFSFGAVVYEMVTGRPAFEGSSPASTMAAILEREPPPMTTLQQLTPPMLDHIVRRCLAKQPDERWQSAGRRDARVEVGGGKQRRRIHRLRRTGRFEIHVRACHVARGLVADTSSRAGWGFVIRARALESLAATDDTLPSADSASGTEPQQWSCH